MKFIHFIAIITICVTIAVASPLMQLIENEDEILAKDVISISNESKSESDESSSDESHEDVTTEFSIFDTHLFTISPSVIPQIPFLQDELKENFSTLNGTQPTITQSYGILSAFNVPWLSAFSFHKQNAAERDAISELNLTVSGELFDSTEEIEATTLNLVTQPINKSTSQKSTTTSTTPSTSIVTSATNAATKKNCTNSTTQVVSTTESIKGKLIEKIAEVAAEPIILTQGVR